MAGAAAENFGAGRGSGTEPVARGTAFSSEGPAEPHAASAKPLTRVTTNALDRPDMHPHTYLVGSELNFNRQMKTQLLPGNNSIKELGQSETLSTEKTNPAKRRIRNGSNPKFNHVRFTPKSGHWNSAA